MTTTSAIMCAVLSIGRPSQRRLDDLARRRAQGPLTYPRGLTDGPRPRWWFVDSVHSCLGAGPEAFDAAVSAMGDWDQMQLGWYVVHRAHHTPVAPGTTVVASARILGLWWSWCCRIVDVVDITRADGSRVFGFAYGTLAGHPARGEERFTVTMDPYSTEVTGSILAISRPASWWVWLGVVVARAVQRSFKPQALAAWARSVRHRLNA